MATESPSGIEPTRLENPPEAAVDVLAELTAASATLGRALHPGTSAHLADLVRIMNTHYSNLIEGHVRIRATSSARWPRTSSTTSGAGTSNWRLRHTCACRRR